MKIVKFLEFQVIKTTIMKNIKIACENHENHGNQKIQNEKHANHENHRMPLENL